MDQKTERLDRQSLPVLPPLHGFAGDDAFAEQVERWRAWIEWEKEDPLVLKDEDIVTYRKRIHYVYKQATMQLRFYPDMWFDAATWCFEQKTEDMTADGAAVPGEGDRGMSGVCAFGAQEDRSGGEFDGAGECG